MELCLFDKYLSEKNQKHLSIEFDEKEYAGYFVENAAFDVDFSSDEYSKTMNLFLTIKNGFLTKHFVSFVDYLVETKIFDWKMKVVLVDEMTDNSKVSIDWLQDYILQILKLLQRLILQNLMKNCQKLKKFCQKKQKFAKKIKQTIMSQYTQMVLVQEILVLVDGVQF